MALVVQYVPPTKDLEGFLYSYIREHLKLNDEKLRQYATFCLKKLPRTCRIGARGRIPTIKEIERSKVFHSSHTHTHTHTHFSTNKIAFNFLSSFVDLFLILVNLNAI
jgi:hypothetical protein